MTQNANTAQLDQIRQISKFRSWVQNIWIDNCEERLTYGQSPATMKEYWAKYKFWLKREYKHQTKAQHDQE
jgi:hypothetical protein